jgi:hypothetical protein
MCSEEIGGVSGTISANGSSVPLKTSGGLLNADQHFGHGRFSSQIHSLQQLPHSSD